MNSHIIYSHNCFIAQQLQEDPIAGISSMSSITSGFNNEVGGVSSGFHNEVGCLVINGVQLHASELCDKQVLAWPCPIGAGP